jgi:uncharacterized membrane protein YqjE
MTDLFTALTLLVRGIVVNRLELFGIELHEVMLRFLGVVIFVLLGVFFFMLCLLASSCILYLALPEEHKLTGLIGLTLLYFIAAAGSFFTAKSKIKQSKRQYRIMLRSLTRGL